MTYYADVIKLCHVLLFQHCLFERNKRYVFIIGEMFIKLKASVVKDIKGC